MRKFLSISAQWGIFTVFVSGMQSARQVSQNAALARRTWNWRQAERRKRIEAVAPFAGPDLEFYKD